MKEYLMPYPDGTYFYFQSERNDRSDVIEIPDGAEVLLRLNSGLSAFYKDNFKKVWNLGIWCSTSNAENLKDKCRLWERESMKEWLLKTEDGKYCYYRDDMDCCPKHVEKIEIPEDAIEARLNASGGINFINNKNCFMNTVTNGRWVKYTSPNSKDAHKLVWERKVHQIEDDSIVDTDFSTEKKHSHYFKDVSNLLEIDVYRVLKLFDVTDPCIQHAVKKLLCAGGSGVKDVDKDVHEAIDSLLRYEEMRKEDENE